MATFEPDMDGWDQLTRGIIATNGVTRMRRVADAANAADSLEDGYRVGTEGDPAKDLEKHDQRVTVITATAPAMAKNAKHNTLISVYHLAGGE